MKITEGIVTALIGAGVAVGIAYFGGYLDLNKEKREVFRAYAISLKACTQAAKPNDYTAWARGCADTFSHEVAVESLLSDSEFKTFRAESTKWYCYMHIYTGKYDDVKEKCAVYSGAVVDGKTVTNLWPNLQEVVRELLIN